MAKTVGSSKNWNFEPGDPVYSKMTNKYDGIVETVLPDKNHPGLQILTLNTSHGSVSSTWFKGRP